jgi:hypothetical protein
LSCRNVVCLSQVLLYLLVFTHFLIPFKGLIPLILINTVSEVRSWSPRGDPKIFGCLYSTL